MLLRYEKQTMHTVVRPAKTVKTKYKAKDKKIQQGNNRR